MIQIVEFDSAGRDVWNGFVRAHPLGTLYHLFEWKSVFESAYGLTTHYLGARDKNGLYGVFPVVEIPRLGVKNLAVSLPYLNIGGWLVSRDTQIDEVRGAFLLDLAHSGVSSVEVRLVDIVGDEDSGEVTFQRSVPDSSEVLWKSLDAKVRNQVRKAQKLGLRAGWGTHQLEEFYSVYSRTMHGLGTPAHDERFFLAISRAFPGAFNVLTVRSEGKTIAAMVLLTHGKQITDPWAGSLREYDALCPNMLMYWEAMKYAAEQGCTMFDLGRSQVGSGTYRFKEQWGAQPVPLKYERIDTNGVTLPTSVSFYRSRQGILLSRLWKSLPAFLTAWLGPKVRRFVP